MKRYTLSFPSSQPVDLLATVPTSATGAGQQPSPDGPPCVWVVPHTHWDREWYLPFEQSRVHLAHLLDEVLEALEQDPSLCFTLDGQAVILEDYLEIRPRQEARLRGLLASGRLVAGPSYVLPDEFLAGQEALVRNLLMGRQVCLRYDAAPMAVAYAPDTFGHVAQLPQILQGFGIDSFVFWRGLGDEADRLGAVFHWQAPDGSRVLAVRLLEGYANARDLGRWTRREGWVLDRPELWPERAAGRVAELLERWREPIQRAGLRDLLLGNGVDHQPLQRDLPEMLAACRERLPGTDFRIASYQGYVDALRRRLGEVQSHEGELAGGREACVVRSVNSTRMYLKQANEATERAIFIAETLAALAALRGPHPDPLPGGEGAWRYPHNELRLAWRELLRNHPHDSLPGCSVDEVHQDMEQRFRSARQIARQVQREALHTLGGREASLRCWEDPWETLSVANVLPWARRGLVEIDLPSGLRGSRWVAETAGGELPVQLSGAPGQRRALIAMDVSGFGARQLRLRQVSRREAPPAGDGDTDPIVTASAVGLATARTLEVNSHGGPGCRGAPMGAPSVSVPFQGGHAGPPLPFTPNVRAVTAAPDVAWASGPRTIENGLYRVEVASNGTLNVTDARTGRLWQGVHWFQDEADRGDEYSFCPLEGDLPWDSRGMEARVRVLAAGPVVAEVEVSLSARLPRGLDPARGRRSRSTAACPLRSVVRLVAGVDRIEFRTTVLNGARDHRLRVLFPAPESDSTVRAEGQFALLRRPAQPVWNGLWREPPAKTHHTSGLVAAGRLALMARGLPEYEAIPNPEGGVDLALTLLRCVGWLSWPDLATRPGAEDPHLPTPGAQCQGSHTFEYAAGLRGEEGDAYLVRASQDYRVELVVGPEGADLVGGLRVEGEGFAFSALKGAEDGEGAILRLYNPGRLPATARVGGSGMVVRRCRLDETGTEPEPVETIHLRAGEIATLRISDERVASGE